MTTETELYTPPSLKTRMKPSEMASLSNSWGQNRQERSDRTTNNGDMAETAKRPVKE